MEDFLLSVGWKNRPLTAKEYLSWSKGLLHELAEFDAVFNNLWGCGSKPNQKVQLSQDLSDFDEKIFPQIYDEKIRYENPDASDRTITLDSKCFKGFRNSYINTEQNGQITISISAGATDKGITNIVTIKFPRAEHPQFYDYGYVSKLMKKLIEYCRPQDGYVVSRTFRRETEKNNTRRDTIPVGWLTYLADPAVYELLPDDITREKLGTGGTLIILKESLPSADDSHDVSRAVRIRNILMTEGLLDW